MPCPHFSFKLSSEANILVTTVYVFSKTFQSFHGCSLLLSPCQNHPKCSVYGKGLFPAFTAKLLQSLTISQLQNYFYTFRNSLQQQSCSSVNNFCASLFCAAITAYLVWVIDNKQKFNTVLEAEKTNMKAPACGEDQDAVTPHSGRRSTKRQKEQTYHL